MGFGFVEFEKPRALQNALRLGNNHKIGRSEVTVEEYVKRGKKFNKRVYHKFGKKEEQAKNLKYKN